MPTSHGPIVRLVSNLFFDPPSGIRIPYQLFYPLCEKRVPDVFAATKSKELWIPFLDLVAKDLDSESSKKRNPKHDWTKFIKYIPVEYEKQLLADLVLHFYWDGNADSMVAYLLNSAANRDNSNPNYDVTPDSSNVEPSPSFSGSSGLADSLALDYEVLEIPDRDDSGSCEDSSSPEVSPKSPQLASQQFRHADQPESDLASRSATGSVIGSSGGHPRERNLAMGQQRSMFVSDPEHRLGAMEEDSILDAGEDHGPPEDHGHEEEPQLECENRPERQREGLNRHRKRCPGGNSENHDNGSGRSSLSPSLHFPYETRSTSPKAKRRCGNPNGRSGQRNRGPKQSRSGGHLGRQTLQPDATDRESGALVEPLEHIPGHQRGLVAHAANLIRNSKKIAVITGAGICTNLGIQDFRSEGTGLYWTLKDSRVAKPEDVFSEKAFKANPSIFYSVVKDMITRIMGLRGQFTRTHAFIAQLQEEGKLLTNYTQNIDDVEASASIPPEKIVQCHGSLRTSTCIACNFKAPTETFIEEIKAGECPKCPKCFERASRWRRCRKDFPTSIMKPDITLYGEYVPDFFRDRLESDWSSIDLVLVIGTSFIVEPVKGITPPNVPRISISKTPINHISFDVQLIGDCDNTTAALCEQLGWSHKIKFP